jgi:hypothetical protein
MAARVGSRRRLGCFTSSAKGQWSMGTVHRDVAHVRVAPAVPLEHGLKLEMSNFMSSGKGGVGRAKHKHTRPYMYGFESEGRTRKGEEEEGDEEEYRQGLNNESIMFSRVDARVRDEPCTLQPRARYSSSTGYDGGIFDCFIAARRWYDWLGASLRALLKQTPRLHRRWRGIWNLDRCHREVATLQQSLQSNRPRARSCRIGRTGRLDGLHPALAHCSYQSTQNIAHYSQNPLSGQGFGRARDWWDRTLEHKHPSPSTPTHYVKLPPALQQTMFCQSAFGPQGEFLTDSGESEKKKTLAADCLLVQAKATHLCARMYIYTYTHTVGAICNSREVMEHRRARSALAAADRTRTTTQLRPRKSRRCTQAHVLTHGPIPRVVLEH